MSDTEGADLSSCDREPIHIPGSIQPHGAILVLDPGDLRLLQASANADRLLGCALDLAFGRRLADLPPSWAGKLAGGIEAWLGGTEAEHLATLDVGGQAYYAASHRSRDCVVVELEEAGRSPAASLETVYPRIRNFADALQRASGPDELGAIAAREIRALIGFDRVLIYRFDPEWNGTVIAEDRNQELPSYQDLRFPATDIPSQARELYRLNRLRIIPDAGYEPVPLVPTLDPRSGEPLDLSHSLLRSVSPVHVEYMRNMGTAASMSLSIIIEDRLWGLVSCHNRLPRHAPLDVRTACDFLSQIFASELAVKLRTQGAELRIRLLAQQAELVAWMAQEEDFTDGLLRHPAEFLAQAQASGAAVVFEGTPRLVGETPCPEDVQAIVDWLASNAQGDVFATDALARHMPGAERFADKASGLLAIEISGLHAFYVLWFRPEVARSVKWGGDPRKPAHPGEDGRIHPRRSFEIWQETLRLRSDPWDHAVVAAAGDLRNAVVRIVLRKAEELAELTAELERANKELESFSYSVSHDLRAPFRHVVGYAELLRERATGLDERSQHYIRNIIDSAFTAGKLVDDLLAFSQMGRAGLNRRRVDLNKLIAEVRRTIEPDLKGRSIEWRVANLPEVWADPSMLRQVLMNLLGNAVKFTRETVAATIEIGAVAGTSETVIYVRDNGIGFDMAYVAKLFGVFQRLHRPEDYEGTGIGLANVRRIVERHGGRVWAEGKLNEGAAFFLALPNGEADG